MYSSSYAYVQNMGLHTCTCLLLNNLFAYLWDVILLSRLLQKTYYNNSDLVTSHSVFNLAFSVCRALGMPCRSVTNFSSAHDTDQSMTIDYCVTKDGEKTKEDSVW